MAATAAQNARGVDLGLAMMALLLAVCYAPHSAEAATAGPSKPISEDVYHSVIVKPLRPKGPIFVLLKGRHPITLGTRFELDCNVGMSVPGGVGVGWRKNGSPVVETRGLKIMGWLAKNEEYKDYEIRFLNFTVDDAGTYTCVTPWGNLTRELVVQPVITEIPGDQLVQADDHVVLSCATKGYPTPRVEWIMPNGRVRHHSTIRMNVTGSKHNGTFTCRASNSAGTTTQNLTVFIREPLQFLTVPSLRVVKSEAQPIQLDCSATGSPQPAYTWYVKPPGQAVFKLVSNESLATLTLTQSAPQSQYKCEVHSRFPERLDDAMEPMTRVFVVAAGHSYTANPLDVTVCVGADCSAGQSVRQSSLLLLLALLLSSVAVHHLS